MEGDEHLVVAKLDLFGHLRFQGVLVSLAFCIYKYIVPPQRSENCCLPALSNFTHENAALSPPHYLHTFAQSYSATFCPANVGEILPGPFLRPNWLPLSLGGVLIHASGLDFPDRTYFRCRRQSTDKRDHQMHVVGRRRIEGPTSITP